MKKLWPKLKIILPAFLFWSASIVFIGSLSIRYLPFTPTFPYYGDISSYGRGIASFAHFDGIHYLRIIYKGYDDMGSQAFFPIYPLLIRTLSFGYLDPLYVAIVVNFNLIIASLYLLTKQLTLGVKIKFLLLFLSFPTSFYLLANYTESLFIFLVSLFFYLSMQKKYFAAAFIAGIASGTRVVGVFLALALFIELIQSKKSAIHIFLLTFLSISGLIGYSLYLASQYGDPLKFVHVMSMFGVGRSTGEIVLLPQLLYRYFRVLTTVSLTSIIGIRALWELCTLFAVSLGLWLSRHVIPIPVMAFCLAAIIFPTLSGTLSSFPRYVLVAVPLFVGLSRVLSSRALATVVVIQYGILITALALFVQGIFIA